MQIDLAALLSFLPQFVVAGAVSIYFYSTFKNVKFRESPDVTLDLFITRTQQEGPAGSEENDIVQASALDRIMQEYSKSQAQNEIEETMVEDGVPHSEYRSSYNHVPFVSYGMLGDTQLVLLTLDLWILLSLLLSPIRRLSSLLPSFPSGFSYIIYTILAAVIAMAILSTVISRAKIPGKVLPLLIVGAGAMTIAAFYAPSMTWINSINTIIRIVIIYSAVVMVCMAVYAIVSYLKRKSAFKASTYASFVSYGITAFILFFNLFTLVFQ